MVMDAIIAKTDAMTDDEKRQFQSMQNDVGDVKRLFSAMSDKVDNTSDKVDQMYYALVGNELTKDGGMVKRQDKMETKIDELQTQITGLKGDMKQWGWKTRLMWSLVGTVGAGILSCAFQVILYAVKKK